jgi:hypothetical protein
VRLEPGEVPRLPLPAALVDRDGRLVAATPEWAGPGPGTISYHTGYGHLLVAPDVPTPHLDVLMTGLLDELRAAGRAMPHESALRARLLAAGLELVAGHPVAAAGVGPAAEVIELALAGIRARTQELPVRVAGPLPDVTAPAPAAVALALVQLAVNAREHERAPSVVLSVAPGPTFLVEWPAGAGPPARVRSHRHGLRRARWGWGYVQMVADALGGAALPPGPTAPGVVGACLGLGSLRLALPLACVREGRVERATEAWGLDDGMSAAGETASPTLARLVEQAERRPGWITYLDLYRARAAGGRTWAALAPESGANRAADVLRGLRHERALLDAPEPHATRIQALATLLERALGAPWPSPPPGLYRELLPAACAALGVAPPAAVDVLAPPEPRVVAFLLSRLGGRLVQRGEDVYLQPPPSAAADPLLRALGSEPDRSILLNSSPDR